MTQPAVEAMGAHAEAARAPAPRIAVIIPFFQREPGILARSLASIVKQDYPRDRLRVVIVDDGSPVPARDELARITPPLDVRIDVIVQQNAGPNEARNTALESLDSSIDLVAYLDSDDEWIGDHLNRAVRALSQGYSVYFANLFHLGDTMAEFEKAKRVDYPNHPLLAGEQTIREYRGDMTSQIVTANIMFMPSLVVDARALGQVRFPKAHRHGGGDYLYWLALVEAGARLVFSTEPEVRCGSGFNMWYASGWGTDRLAKRICDEARFRRTALNRYVKDPQTRETLRRRLVELQREMLLDALHRLRRRKPLDWPLLRTFFTENPPTISVAATLAKSLATKALGRRG